MTIRFKNDNETWDLTKTATRLYGGTTHTEAADEDDLRDAGYVKDALPDPGDVEPLANDMWWTYHNDFHGEIVKQGTMGVMRLLAGGVVRRYAARESALRAERDAAVAEVAALREVLRMNLLDFGLVNVAIEANPALALHPFTQAVKQTETALATPASPAAARYAALEELWASTKRFDDAQHAGEDNMALALAKADFDAATARLRALDGGDA